MTLFVVFLLCIVLGLCLTEGKSKKGFMGVLLALLYLPFGAIFSLSKKYK